MCGRACVRAPTHDHPFNCVCVRVCVRAFERVCDCVWTVAPGFI